MGVTAERLVGSHQQGVGGRKKSRGAQGGGGLAAPGCTFTPCSSSSSSSAALPHAASLKVDFFSKPQPKICHLSRNGGGRWGGDGIGAIKMTCSLKPSRGLMAGNPEGQSRQPPPPPPQRPLPLPGAKAQRRALGSSAQPGRGGCPGMRNREAPPSLGRQKPARQGLGLGLELDKPRVASGGLV